MQRPETDPRAPLTIVLNPASGREDGAANCAALEQALRSAGRSYRLLLPGQGSVAERARQAVKLAAADRGAGVAAGGDGTLNAVAQCVLGSGLPFGILPQGTFNYFGRTHGIPADTAAAVQILLNAPLQPVQAGQVNERVFLVNASLGLYPEVLQDREVLKQRYGRRRIVAAGAALATLLREHRQLQIAVERSGRVSTVRTPTLFIGNNRLQLEQIGMAGAEAVEQGLLAAILPRPVGTLAMLGLALRGALGRLGEAEQVDSFGFSTLRVQPDAPYGGMRMKVACDGEIAWQRAPLLFRVATEPLWLYKPEAR